MHASTELLYPIASSATRSRGIAAGEDQDPRVAQLIDEPVKLAVPAALMMPIACSGAAYRQGSDGLCSAFWAAAPKKLCRIPSGGILSCISHCDWQRHRVTSPLLVDER
jgi:hypothetical protein